jgi:hypothetical protein
MNTNTNGIAPEQNVTFERWADAAVDAYGVEVAGDYSRLAWLPIVGPSTWLIWGTAVNALARQPVVVWDAAELARAHGIGGLSGVLDRTLDRLAMFGLAGPMALDRSAYAVRMTCPPLTTRQLRRSPAWLLAIHDEFWPAEPPDAATG